MPTPNPHLLLLPSFGWPELVLVALLFATALICLLSLLHCAVNKRLTVTPKAHWILAIAFLPLVGALIYLSEAPRRRGRHATIID